MHLRSLILVTALLVSQSLMAEQTCPTEKIVSIKQNTKFPANCNIAAQVVINTGDLEFDCNGGSLIAENGAKFGIFVNSKGQPLKNVKIKNCNISGFSANGILIGWGGPDIKKQGSKDELYNRTPTDITVSNVTVDKSGRVGIYIDDYASDIVLDKVVVQNSAGVGIYLEHSTKNIKIINSTIKNNGLGGLNTYAGREGLAIDSSANNIVEGNKFISNKGGGIFLYKNCGERHKYGEVLRWQHSDNNLIKDNYFENEKVGVWIASRQRKDLRVMECGDPMIDPRGWYQDYANNNTLDGNIFCNTETPIIDYGENNKSTNSFNGCKK